MRLLLVATAVFACSGDDGHKQSTLPGPTTVVVTPAKPPMPPVVPVAPPAAGAAPLTEDMAAPYFTTGDAGNGVRLFGLERWLDARTDLAAARTQTKDPAAIARLELLLGLVEERLENYTTAVPHLAAARAGLPLLADYVTYHLALATYLSHGSGSKALAAAVDRASIVGAEAE
ncbi:MAG: hypothetical protein NT062_18000, partial [Proteobacteria bacterium]|nr:hypothetical protein [Pseudomonadota bacterium]